MTVEKKPASDHKMVTPMIPDQVLAQGGEALQPIIDGWKQRTFLMQSCDRCGHINNPPAATCGNCRDQDTGLEFVEVLGNGTLQDWSIPSDGSSRTVATVELDVQPGLIVVGRIRDYPPEELSRGMVVEVVWEPVSGGTYVPYWQPRVPPRSWELWEPDLLVGGGSAHDSFSNFNL